ncbi:MAG: LysR family transcriptional regulator, partial [Proteobacteria bacterium]|nr:LysR family transcriptional regulator [Pseudomonadota bacterium]
MADRIDTIAIFVAVAELGSFAAAARRLNRTPAAVTRAVAALEQTLRTRLLNRTTRSVALTDDGSRYLDACRRLLAAYDEVSGIEPAESSEPHGVLHVTAPAAFGRLHVLPAIEAYLRRHPRVEVRALLLDRVVSLVEEGLDVGVRIGDLPDSSLRAVRVGSVNRAVYANPDYLARHGTPDTPQALRGHAIVGCSAVTPLPDRWT